MCILFVVCLAYQIRINSIQIKSLITERNDREYYLSLNTNHFKVKMRHLKKLNTAIQEELNRKIKDKKHQIQLWKQEEQKLKSKQVSTSVMGHEALYKKGMTEGQLRGYMLSERQLKAKTYEARQQVTECEREIQELEYKKLRYQNEFQRKKMILQTEESDYRQMYNFKYEKELKQPKMKRSLGRKRALLHDTLHSNLKPNHLVTAYETKEGEEYTIELLRKAEEKDLEVQQKFIEKIVKKQEEEEHLRKKQEEKAKLRKRLASARPFHQRNLERKERCYSAIMKKKEEIRQSNAKKPFVPPEKVIGFNTIAANSKRWNQFETPVTQNQKFISPASMKYLLKKQEL